MYSWVSWTIANFQIAQQKTYLFEFLNEVYFLTSVRRNIIFSLSSEAKLDLLIGW